MVDRHSRSRFLDCCGKLDGSLIKRAFNLVWDDPSLLADPRTIELIQAGNPIASGVKRAFLRKVRGLSMCDIAAREAAHPGWTLGLVGEPDLDESVIAVVLDSQAAGSPIFDICATAIRNLLLRKQRGIEIGGTTRIRLAALRSLLADSIHEEIDRLIG